MNTLKNLENWFSCRCDGDWEHGCGIKITTLDNPGWSIDISLRDTELVACVLEIVKTDRSEEDWFWCWTEGEIFKARGGPKNLEEMIGFFLAWADRISR